MPTVTGDNFYINKHTLQFRTGETGVASIVYDKTDESISIANAGTGQISIGDAGGDIYIGDGTIETDIIFEQNGAIRALANKTLKLGQGDSDVKVEAQNFFVTGDSSLSGDISIIGSGSIGLTSGSAFNSEGNRLVIGDGVGAEGLTIFSGPSHSASILFADGTDGNSSYEGFIQYRHGEEGFRFGAGGGGKVFIGANNTVGIGSLAPNAELEIASSVPTLRLTDSDLTNHYTDIEKAGVYTYLYSRANASNGGFIFLGTAGSTDTEFMRIDTAGSVGIGTNSPTSKLHVKGPINITRTVNTDTSNIDMEGNFRFIANNGYRTTFFNNGAERVRFDVNGRVGIGSTSPAYKLDVAGSVQAKDAGFLAGVGGDADGFIFHDLYNGAGNYWGYKALSSPSRLAIVVDGSEALTVDSNARVGIGMTGTGISAQFYNNLVVGNDSAGEKGITIRSNASNGGHIAFSDTDAANAGRYAGRISYSHSTNKMQFYTTAGDHAMTIDNAQSVGIGTTAPSDFHTSARNLVVGNGAGSQGITIYAQNNAGSSLYLADGTAGDQAYRGYITYSHSAEKLSLGAGGQTRITATNAGLVGINQTNPTSLLHIYGGNVTGLAGSLRNDSKNRMNMKVAMADVTRYIGTVTQYGNGDSSGFTIRLYDGAEKVFRIIRVVVQNSSGTNFPSITVEGGGEDTDIHIDLKYKNRDGDATKTDFFLDPTGSKFFNQYIEIEGFIFKEEGYNTTSLTSVSLDDDLALNVLDHAHGSRVGVGTTDPPVKFAVNSAGDDAVALFESTDNDAYLTIKDNTDSVFIGHDAALDVMSLGFNSSMGVSSNVNIDTNGFVGLGTNDPATRLDVVGTYRIADNTTNANNKLHRMLGRHYTNAEQEVNIFSSISTSTTNALSFGGGSSSYNTATNIYFYTASNNTSTYAVGQERMRITNAGNIGIGVTSDPSSKLHVNGELTASTKTFDIEHPTQSGKRLVHGCFEGPEYGVYFRGKTQDSGIQAPEYWSGLVDIDSMTVDVTPIGPNQSIYVDRIEDNGDVYVGANTEEPLNYFYIVYGERKDIDNLVIVKDAPVASSNEHID